jgi:hypothetical protein
MLEDVRRRLCDHKRDLAAANFVEAYAQRCVDGLAARFAHLARIADFHDNICLPITSI